jgi:NTE family protein
MNTPDPRRRKNDPLVGLALGGGAARGIAHIGVLQALVDNDIPIDFISGTSAGAIVAASFAFGRTPPEIKVSAKRLSWYALSSFPDSKLGLASNRALEKMMEDIMGKKDITEAKIPLAVMTTDIENGARVVFREGKAALAVRASCCIPGLFAPVDIDGRKLLDGGLSENVPLSPLKEMGADILIGVNLIHWHSERKVQNALDVVANAMDIMTARQEEDHERHGAIMISPDLGNFSSSDFKKIDALVEAGYRATMKKMPEIKERVGKRRREKQVKKGFWAKLRKWLRD